MYKERNLKLANELKDFLEKNNLSIDTRIYFNGMAYDDDSDGKYFIIEDIKGSNYFEYANDDTVSMSFEGVLYELINYYDSSKLYADFYKIFEDNNCWFELGFAWSLSVYYD